MKLSFVVSFSKTNFKALAQGNWNRIINYLGYLGYDGVELAVRDPKEVPVDILKETLQTTRLSVPAIGTGQVYLSDNLSLSSSDRQIRQWAVDRIEEHIQLAKSLGADVIIGLVRGGVIDRDNYEKGIHFFSESLKALCDRAERDNVNLLIEPINRYETSLFPTMESTAALINTLNSDKVWILIDTFHMNIEEADMCLSISRFGSLIGHVHFADSNRLAPGCGHIDFCAILQSLREIGYNRFISFEILPEPSIEQAAADSIKHIKSIIASTEVEYEQFS